MSDTVQQIKERLDLADFVRVYVQLSPAGKNLKGLCPFHKEKTPSFIVSPDRQIWHCFGCSAGGDLIGFLMRYENLEFFEALKILAEKAGIDLGRTGTQDQRQINLLYEANRLAKEFFKFRLSDSGQAALEYLKSRGLKKETIEEFEIGFAPDSPDALAKHLLNAGHNIALIEKAGLVFKTERGTYLDRFRNRIMFPLANQFGKIVGFTGRIMPGFENENIGKYVNSPETPVFNKSKLLYGLDKSKSFIRENKTAVLVEGQMDFLMAWQDGVKNLAATSGTAITPEHLKSLSRIADVLILSFDQDSAGQAAAERTIDLASSADFSIKVLRWPEDLKAKDPADIVNAHPGILKTFVEKAQPAMEYYFQKYKIGSAQAGSGEPNLNVPEWKKNIRFVLSKIKALYSPVEKAHWLKELASGTGIEESHLVEEMENLKPESHSKPNSAIESAGEEKQPAQSRKDLICQRIASLALNHGNFHLEVEPHLDFFPSDYRSIITYHFDNKLSLAPELQSLADLVSLRSGLETNLDPLKARAELFELLRQLKLEIYKEQRQQFLLEIRNSEKNNDEVGLSQALEKFDKVSKEIQNLETNHA